MVEDARNNRRIVKPLSRYSVGIALAVSVSARLSRIAVDFMASGEVNLKPLLSGVISLDEIQKEGFERLKTDKSLIKVLVKP